MSSFWTVLFYHLKTDKPICETFCLESLLVLFLFTKTGTWFESLLYKCTHSCIFQCVQILSGTTLCTYTVVCYQTNTLQKWRGWKVHKCGFHNFNKLWTIPINSWGEWEYFNFYKHPPPPLNVKSNSQPLRLIQNHKSHTMISFLINLSTSF